MALWGGRFTQAADQRFKQLNDSLRFDYRLAEQDIVCLLNTTDAADESLGGDLGGRRVIKKNRSRDHAGQRPQRNQQER
ncbi:hypothetical protein, partial [Salmonella enterica]|uniref:hypothetical protein n=1 Tax=Salmonella enterica TaxID=28901 RepID=UPI00398C442D